MVCMDLHKINITQPLTLILAWWPAWHAKRQALYVVGRKGTGPCWVLYATRVYYFLKPNLHIYNIHLDIYTVLQPGDFQAIQSFSYPLNITLNPICNTAHLNIPWLLVLALVDTLVHSFPSDEWQSKDPIECTLFYVMIQFNWSQVLASANRLLQNDQFEEWVA